VEHAGGGSTCASHATVRHFLAEALEPAGIDVTIVDMEPGLEHLSRVGGTLGPVDIILVVLEPNETSLVTATRAIALAEGLGIPRVHGLGNKARGVDDEAFLSEAAESHDVAMVGILPYDTAVAEAERAGGLPAPSPALWAAIEGVADRLEWLTVRSRSRRSGRAGRRHPEGV
jgi:CO dehydrogenase maturation factor